MYGHLAALGIPADEPLLAKDEVRYKGQPIAVVAAEDEETAQAAVEAIEIDFEERTALFDIRKAFDPDAPQVHHWGNWYPHFEGEMDRRQIRKGDIDEAFEQADVIVAGRLPPCRDRARAARDAGLPGRPRADGRLTIYSCTQAMYFSMGVVAAHLQVPLNKLKFVGGTVGGGFGGKVDTATETMSALLAHEVGPAGQVALDARGGVPLLLHPGAVAHGDRRRGHEGRLDPRPQDADAARLGRVRPLLAVRRDEARFHHTGAYTIPNLAVRRLRRLHEPHADDRDARLRRHVRLVRHRDAHEPHRAELGIDPFEIRLKNANRIGDTSPNGVGYTDPSTVPTIQAVADAVGHELPAELPHDDERRRATGELLPEHLVAQLGDPEDH